MSKKDPLILIETFNLKVISNWNAWFISEPSVTFNHCIHPPVSWPRQSQYESIFPKLWGKILYIYNISSALFGSWDKTPQKNVRLLPRTFSFQFDYLQSTPAASGHLILWGENLTIFQKEIQVFNISKKYNIFWSPSKCNFLFCKPTCLDNTDKDKDTFYFNVLLMPVFFLSDISWKHKRKPNTNARTRTHTQVIF